MKILLTNDDGISAKGLLALKNELSKIADCVVVAPECEQSAVGHAITISKPLEGSAVMVWDEDVATNLYQTSLICVDWVVPQVLVLNDAVAPARVSLG